MFYIIIIILGPEFSQLLACVVKTVTLRQEFSVLKFFLYIFHDNQEKD